MTKQNFEKNINSLSELLKNKFPSSLTKRIELDDDFSIKAQQFTNETLDFSYYSELERIVNTSKVQGVIKKNDVSKNKDLIELTLPNQKLGRLDLKNNKKLVVLKVNNNQLSNLDLSHNSQLEHLDITCNEITGTWDIAKCSKIKFLACQNNYLNELRVHKDLRYLLVNSLTNYLKSQNHNKEKIHPLKNITYATPSVENNNKYTEKNDERNNNCYKQPQNLKPQTPSWKSLYSWLQKQIIDNELKDSQKANYPNLSKNALNRFVNSLEATLDNNNCFHLFPKYDDNKYFEELFNFDSIFCGNKAERKRIGENSYSELRKLFYNWKKDLNFLQGKTETKTTTKTRAIDAKVRNILLIGRTGSGKSTLANVLVNKNGEFEEVFKESSRSISETKSIQTEEFTINLSKDGAEKIHYLIIDTIGFGDTKLNDKEVLRLLQDLVPIIKQNGLNQVFFVTNGRFTEKEIEIYKLLESVLFDKEVVDFTTIVRTKFPEFEERLECEEDAKTLQEENAEIFRILKASRIIHVNNPPLIGRSLEKNKEIREESNKKLLNFLITCQDIYHSTNLNEFSKRINDYQTKHEQLEKELRNKEKINSEQEEKFQSEINSLRTKQQIDLELSRRKFEQKINTTKSGYEWKLKYAQEQLESKYQEQLKDSQKRYEQEQEEAEKKRQTEVTRIESEFKNRKVNFGEAVCSRGHSNVTSYNKYGNLPDPDDFDDSIHYVYCSSCGKNDYNPELRNAKSYNFEEWCQMRNQSYARELEEMNRQIQEQQRRKQETLAQIEKERKERNVLFEKELERERQLQAQIVNKEKKINEEKINQDKLFAEKKINSSSQEKIDQLNNELSKQKQTLEELRRQSQAKKNNSQQKMETYIEQLLNPSH